MFARRRRQKEEKNKLKAVEDVARGIVQKEIDSWKSRIHEAREENKHNRNHYQNQEEELRRGYVKACQQLDRRRATLLATTSLIPYTQIIQAASSFRIPAALLTLQARLCLHVHCLCIHEELLLKTKEQGWDTIAWMEDVSRQLRLLTQKQTLLLRIKMKEKVEQLQEMDCKVVIPELIQYTLDQPVFPLSCKESNGRAKAGDVFDQQDLPVSAETLDHQTPLVKAPQLESSCACIGKNKERSFLEFLQRYELQKAHEQKADQMRLAQFRSRCHFASSVAPKSLHTSRQASAGKTLKNYASKLFNGSSSTMDESLHFEDICSSDKRAGSGKGVQESASNFCSENGISANTDANPSSSSWIQSIRQRTSSGLFTKSESNLDMRWSWGSSWREAEGREAFLADSEFESKAGLREQSVTGHDKVDREAGNHTSLGVVDGGVIEEGFLTQETGDGDRSNVGQGLR